ncbi:hypothetical protein Tdes44962_MAKER04048 [Teratosphaeria destructans]|uniref:Uncharacterized protein n=1 Tax=Teratosphaeria destructans TaxID=418781 RepID=A0A9W7W0H3_9PEZI|nr:hypothetical protein Tdes44962_MAKER04048 [Teratosphaeria destructans]
MTIQASRFSTYSGAPSIQPSLASTFETSSNRSSPHASQQTILTTNIMSAKGQSPYANSDLAVVARSSSTLASSDPKSQDLRSWSGSLERMQDERLQQQRYVMSGSKSEEIRANALGAKVERALARRMTGQDAQFTAKKSPMDEKRALEVEAS